MSENYWQLVDKAKAGDRQAMVDLYAATNIDTYRAIFSLTANEETAARLTANTYETAFKNLDKLGDASRFPGWCRTIGENTGKNYMTGKAAVTAGTIPDSVPMEANRLVMRVIGDIAAAAFVTPVAPATPAAAAAPAAKKKSGKVIVIALIIVALLVGGFFAVKPFFDNGGEAADDPYGQNGSTTADEPDGPADAAPEQTYAMMNEEALERHAAGDLTYKGELCGRTLADLTHDGIPELVIVSTDVVDGERKFYVSISVLDNGVGRIFWERETSETNGLCYWIYEEDGKAYMLQYFFKQDGDMVISDVEAGSFNNIIWTEGEHGGSGYGSTLIIHDEEISGLVDENRDAIDSFWNRMSDRSNSALFLIDFSLTGGTVLASDVYNGDSPFFSLIEDLFGPVPDTDTTAAVPIEHLLCATLEEIFAEIGEGVYDRGDYLYDGLTVHQYYGGPDNFVINGPGYSVYDIKVGDSEEHARAILEQFPPIEGQGDVNVMPPDWHYVTDGVYSLNYLSVFFEDGVVKEMWYGMVFIENY